jgi:hypothetical protein
MRIKALSPRSSENTLMGFEGLVVTKDKRVRRDAS